MSRAGSTAAFRMRQIRILEGAHDVDQRVGLGQMPEQLAAHSLFGHALGDAGDVEVLHVGLDLALRLEHFGQRDPGAGPAP